MRYHNYLLRGIQILTFIVVVVIVVFGYTLFAGNPEQAEPQAKTKIKRIADYKKAAESNPRDPVPYEKIGDSYFLEKNYASAKQNFEFAESLKPGNSLLAIKIARSLIGQRKILDAKIKLEKIDPDTQESIFYKGLIAAFLNQQGEAKDLLTQTIETGVNEEIKRNAQKILDIYKEFELVRDGKMEFLQAMLAQAFDQIDEPGLAIELAFDALKTQYDYRDIWVILGHAFLSERKWTDALDALTKAINLDSNHPASFFFRGIANKNLDKTDAAMRDFEKSLKLGYKPQIFAKYELAELYFLSKDFEKSFKLYKEVVTSDASEIDRFVRPIALAINHLKKPDEALELAKKAYSAHPNSSMSHNLLGWAYIATKDFKNAHQHLEEAIKLDPELAAAVLNLGQLAQVENKQIEALNYYEKAIDLAEKSDDPMASSIIETAKTKYNAIKAKPSTEEEKNAPQSNKIQPSLSLL